MKKLLISFLILPLGLASVSIHASEEAGNSGEDAAAYLEIYKEFSGKCMGLRRGDMRMMRNTHPGKAIEYRMIRLLGGQRQASIIRDTIDPGDEGQKLGCEFLDDREQTYEIVQARFAD